MPHVTFRSSAGALAGLHDPPTGPRPAAGPRAAVVCHPHPLGGGTKDNKVVHAAAKVLASRGLHVLRFDFRGVGRSEGRHDEGVGEQDDARAALDHAAALLRADDAADGPGSLLVVGYSFGSFVGLAAALGDDRVAARLAIAPPVRSYDYGAIGADPRPLAVVYAEEDELVPAEAVRDWITGCAAPPDVTAVPGAGHLFHRKLDAVRAAVDRFATRSAGAAGLDSPP